MAPQDMKIPPRSGDVPDDGDSDLGDFVTTEEEEGDIEYYCEDSSRYNSEASRAFYPICIGEILSDRYRIDHKLGHGGFSTVWLAYDLEKKTVVALKVTDSSEKGKYEAQIPEEIIRRVKDTSHVLTYLRAFSLQGEASNRHQVLVFPWVGECFTFPKLEKLSMASRMLAARQMFEALNHLHRAGIVHWDVTGYNCFQGIAPLKIIRRSTNMNYLVALLSYPSRYGNQPSNLAVNVSEQVTGEREGRPPMRYCSQNGFMASHPAQPATCGVTCVHSRNSIWDFPLSGIHSEVISLPDTKPNPQGAFEILIKRLRPDIDQAELEVASSLFRRGFCLEPEKRPTAAELLQDPLFKALMDRYT
ncbi:serine/threonine protein kinase [Trichophyton violaceum]|uniref:Serine/threonine protein kinase n=1 Tax=Trichophyton violaceum TaxID=34388 RepID=A0A178FNR1_TRIVO|nr:serine/threonine protein kinase [Trichophyton violaceum]